MELQQLRTESSPIQASAHALHGITLQDPDAASASSLLPGQAMDPTESERDYEDEDEDVIAEDIVKWSRSPVGLIIAVSFTSVLILQWTLVCILSRRPISTRCNSYNESVICDWSTAEKATQLNDLVQLFRYNERWIQATQVLAAVLGVLMIPMTTAVCARAVATMSTAGSNGTERGITLIRTLTFANKSWSDPMFFYSMVSNVFARRAANNWLFFLSVILTILGAIIFPLQSQLVKRPTVPKVGPRSYITDIGIEGTLSALKFGFGPYSSFDGNGNNTVLDFQTALSRASSTVQGQSTMDWIWYAAGVTPNVDSLQSFQVPQGPSDMHWTSFFPSTTSTGFLQNYSLGIGSSVQCSAADYPSKCAGENPFTYDLNYPVPPADTFVGSSPETVSIRLCIPGNMYQFPWQNNETQGQSSVEESKQTITETLYMSYFDASANSSIMCTCNSTSGYFELPNELNNTKPRAMLTTYNLSDPALGNAFNPSTVSICISPSLPSLILGAWPPISTSVLANSENYIPTPSGILNTSLPNTTADDWEEQCKVTGYPWTAYHGPLLSSIIVLFTNASNNNQCRQGVCPIGYYPPISSDVGKAAWPSDWGEMAPDGSTAPFTDYAEYLRLFSGDGDPAGGMEDVLNIMTFLASQSALQLVGQMGDSDRTGQGLQVVQAVGSFNLERVQLSLWALVVISVIVALYITGLLFVGIWGSRRESWTPTLDPLAMLILGARLHARLPPLEGHALNGVAEMGEKYDGIPGGIGRGKNYPLSRLRRRRPR